MTKDTLDEPPKIYKLSLLPKFIQMGTAEMWEKNGVKPNDNVDLIFTYFDGIYSGRAFATDIFVHESVHYVRQGSGKDENRAKEWWLRYWTDPEFRYAEELLAYREQYQFIYKKTNKAVAFDHAKRLAGELSGVIYGSLRPFQTALGDIIRK